MVLLKIKTAFDEENNWYFVSQTHFEKIILKFMQWIIINTDSIFISIALK